jgi:hypothetical protein
MPSISSFQHPIWKDIGKPLSAVLISNTKMRKPSIKPVWADAIAMMAPESLCDPWNVVITRKSATNYVPYTEPQIAGHTIYMDLLPNLHVKALPHQPHFNATCLWFTRPQEILTWLDLKITLNTQSLLLRIYSLGIPGTRDEDERRGFYF